MTAATERMPRPRPPELPLGAALAMRIGNVATALSRASGLGSGGMIGGRVMRKLRPAVLAELSRGRTSVLVTGTNGKTTTTLMLARALGGQGDVAHNVTGANMLDGLVAALAAHPHASLAALEVDERYLPVALPSVAPAAVALLNLSRDQMDRVGEVAQTVQVWRTAFTKSPATTVVANCDDPLVTWAALAADRQVWVAAGSSWSADSSSCPQCGASLVRAAGDWHCRCGFRRPQPHWQVADSGTLIRSDGRQVKLALRLPGAINVGNAAIAIAAATSIGTDVRQAVAGVESVDQVAGRYRVAPYHGRQVRTMLAKNPAGWAETLRILRGTQHPLILAVNAREADGRDPSWLWDVPFEELRGRQVTVCGDRAPDLAVRLTYAEVVHRVAPDYAHAITGQPPGLVDVVANYTAFRDVTEVLTHGS
jgi:UDP-N-acetylmuramyl tripeptide synthase